MEELIEYVKLHPYASGVITLIVIVMIVLMYIYRETKSVISIVGNAIVEAEEKLNSETGQRKLEYAVEKIRMRLPKIVSILISKAMLVSIIEFMLNFIGKAFKIEKKVDIKGNE